MEYSEEADVENNAPDNIKKEPPESPRPIGGNDSHGFGEVTPENQTEVETPDHEADNSGVPGTEVSGHIKIESSDEMDTDPSFFSDTIPNAQEKFEPSDADNAETFRYDDLGTGQKIEQNVHAGSFQSISGSNCDYFKTESTYCVKTESEDYVPEEIESYVKREPQESYVKREPQESDFGSDSVMFKTEPLAESDLNIKYEVETSGSSAFPETFGHPNLSAPATATTGKAESNFEGYIPEEMENVKTEPDDEYGVVFKTESETDLNIKYEVETSGSSEYTETFSDPSLSAQATATATSDAVYVKQERHEITDTNRHDRSEGSGAASDMQHGVFVVPPPGQLPIHVLDPLHGGGVQMVPGTVVLVSVVLLKYFCEEKFQVRLGLEPATYGNTA
jgi:hypothetical protein